MECLSVSPALMSHVFSWLDAIANYSQEIDCLLHTLRVFYVTIGHFPAPIAQYLFIVASFIPLLLCSPNQLLCLNLVYTQMAVLE